MKREIAFAKSLKFAEQYGIVNYKVRNNKMVWREKLQNEGIFRHTLNLTTNIETVKQLYVRHK